MPPGKWRAAVAAAQLSPCARIFAVEVLAPLVSRAARIRPLSLAELAERYARVRDRAAITGRRVMQLRRELKDAGLVDRTERPAPGRTARYRALVPGMDPLRPMPIRPRGLAPRRMHALFARETSGTETLIS